MFSIKKSGIFWMRSNAVFMLLVVLLLINIPYWNRDDSSISLFLFIFFAECFLVLLSLVYGFNTKKIYVSPRKKIFKKSNLIVGTITVIAISLFLSFVLREHIPYPSALLYMSLTINFIMAIISLLFPNWVIKQYEFNIYEESSGWINDFLRYFLFIAWAINYEVQVVLARLPFLLQRLMGIVFIIVLVFSIASISSMY
ncbi:hypothetical protein P9G44_05625 [Bacillus paralicheniformis]|uniref:hypothetical protein n=1 Tax=Bacillus TaxID=1386 RepID=UPI000D034569|nr:hypothetical protein [Bacillus paralicheniformis]KAA0835478.1 hypothetical protein EI979_18650 [Bacillus paralicheniformis]KAA0842550.1 hypothetical protein EI977_05065 [Bacillus paralicheniformis]MBR8665803.1 hypothetical protein [Bacillus paralicheniformis]MCY8152515.1 hypothetical protein [Bacillus paralicheniformis]MCY8179707.1 hypothetical protein [Bacillus paralicheniformis]